MSRLLLIVLIFSMACSALSAPLVLVCQEYKQRKSDNDIDPNVLIIDKVAAELNERGKFTALMYSAKSPDAQMALTKLKISVLPEKPDVKTSLSIAKAMSAKYVVVVRAIMDESKLSTNVRLYNAANGKMIWHGNKDYGITLGTATDWENTTQSAARTISYIIATDALKDLPITKPTDEDPKITIPVQPQVEAIPATAVEEADTLKPGMQALALGNNIEAIALLREAVDIKPLSVEARAGLIKAYLAESLNDHAFKEAERARMLIPNDGMIETVYAETLLATGKAEEAEKTFLVILSKQPDNPNLYIGLGDVYMLSHRNSEAIAQYKLATEKNSKSTEALLKLGIAHIRNDEYVKAQEYFEAAKKLGLSSEHTAVKKRYASIIFEAEASLTRIEAKLLEIRQQVNSMRPDKDAIQQQTQNLAMLALDASEFIGKIDIPSEFLTSHQHYALAAQLMAQAAVVARRYTEQNDSGAFDDAMLLRSDSLRELKTAKELYSKEVEPESVK